MRALSPPFFFLLALLMPALSGAQAPAADPAAPTAPLAPVSLPPQPPLPTAEPSPQAWREANDAVAAFPRGHADILAWEARHAHEHPAPGGQP